MASKAPNKQRWIRSHSAKVLGFGSLGLCYVFWVSALSSKLSDHGGYEGGASSGLVSSVPVKQEWTKSQGSVIGEDNTSLSLPFDPIRSLQHSSQPKSHILNRHGNHSAIIPIKEHHNAMNRTFAHQRFEELQPKTYKKTTDDDLSVFKLRMQGVNITKSDLEDIPSWEQVTDIFGSEPVILGLETCEAYRLAVPMQNRSILPAGNFNTGTNLFPEFFHRNCAGQFPQDLMQVNWGKHNLANARLENYVVNKTKYQAILSEQVLPVVMVRHPVSWMFSTCLHSYAASWRHNQRNCPHLVHENRTDAKLMTVRVGYGWNPNGKVRTPYKTLIHFWRDWIHSYIRPDLPFPRLIIRLEDVVFRPEAVLKKVCECAGGRQRYDKVYVPVESVKVQKDRVRKQQNRTGFLVQGKETAGLLEAWSKHSSIAELWKQMKPRDRRVVEEVLLRDDSFNLLKKLHYNLKGSHEQ